jgi:hypothetical protein
LKSRPIPFLLEALQTQNVASLPAKAGRAFLKEGPNAFHAVVRMKAFQLLVDFSFERSNQFIPLAGKYVFFNGPDGHLRTSGYFRGEALDLSRKAVRRKYVIDNSQSVRCFCVNHVRGIEHFRGFRRPHELRQKVGAPVVRKKTHFGETLPEDRFFDSDTNIRGESEIHARAYSRAVHGGDDGLGHGADFKNGLHAGAQDGGDFLEIALRTTLTNHFQVAASTKRAPRTGKDHYVDTRIRSDSRDCVVERGGELIVEGVEAIRPIHCQSDNGVLAGF